MFSGRKHNFEKTRQDHEENEKAGVDDSGHNCNKFSASSDSVITFQESSFLTLNEKRNKLLKLLGRDLDAEARTEAFKAEENSDNVPGDDEKKLISTDEDGSDELRLPSEISEPELEEEIQDENEEDWREFDVNQLNLGSICGLEEIKDSLFNILIYPSLYPQFFPRKIRCNQVLLYGPPGAGKTMLAKALAGEINAPLHKITSADLLSHWQGQTEKQIKNLFEEIQSNSEPKILFFDEIDGLFRKRTNDESDSFRRIKTELLIHLDDFTASFKNHQTFLIGATNCPWEIDASFMRRFHRKIFVPLPDKKARLEIITKSFENIETDLTDSEWNEIGDRTEGYSGSELVNIVMTSCCERFTEVRNSKYWEARGDFWIPVSPASLYAIPMNFEDIHPEKVCGRNIKFADLLEAIGKTRKTVDPETLLKYLEFSDRSKIE